MEFCAAKLSLEAKVPSKATEGSGGFDLYSPTDFNVHSGRRLVLPLNIQLIIPIGYVGLIRSRSGLAFKHKISCFHGTIDSDFRGNLQVILYNSSAQAYSGKRGDRVAQIVIVPVAFEKCIEIAAQTDSGLHSGIGSTGK